MKIKVKILDERLKGEFALPDYQTCMSAGMDLRAMVDEEITLNPGSVVMVNSGIAMHIADPDVTALIVPRSGLGYKHGIVLSNLVGVIDADYQGPLMRPSWNHSDKPYVIHPGDRIAQMLFVPVLHPSFEVCDDFEDKTERGEGGFGSTGRHH